MCTVASVGLRDFGITLVAQNQPSAWSQLLPLLVIMLIFYVLLILPAQRRQRRTNEMLANLKTGDKVITNGGIYGTIVAIEGEAVQLRIADQVRIRILRSAIAGLQPESKEGSGAN